MMPASLTSEAPPQSYSHPAHTKALRGTFPLTQPLPSLLQKAPAWPGPPPVPTAMLPVGLIPDAVPEAASRRLAAGLLLSSPVQKTAYCSILQGSLLDSQITRSS